MCLGAWFPVPAPSRGLQYCMNNLNYSSSNWIFLVPFPLPLLLLESTFEVEQTILKIVTTPPNLVHTAEFPKVRLG